MIRLSHISLMMALAVLLASCGGNGKQRTDAQAEKTRIEREIERKVGQRLEAERKAFDERGRRLRTVRVTGFVVLAGGAASLLWFSQPVRRSGAIPSATSETGRHLQPPSVRRVIDLPPPSEETLS